jgi:hypothetical protein
MVPPREILAQYPRVTYGKEKLAVLLRTVREHRWRNISQEERGHE